MPLYTSRLEKQRFFRGSATPIIKLLEAASSFIETASLFFTFVKIVYFIWANLYTFAGKGERF